MFHARYLTGAVCPPPRRISEDTEHIDQSSLEVINQLIDAAHKTECRLFVLLAVRSSDGIQHETMATWVCRRGLAPQLHA